MEVRIKSEKKKLITFFILVIGQHPVGLEPTNPQSYDNATTTSTTYSNCNPRNILVLKRFEFFLFLIACKLYNLSFKRVVRKKYATSSFHVLKFSVLNNYTISFIFSL